MTTNAQPGRPSAAAAVRITPAATPGIVANSRMSRNRPARARDVRVLPRQQQQRLAVRQDSSTTGIAAAPHPHRHPDLRRTSRTAWRRARARPRSAARGAGQPDQRLHHHLEQEDAQRRRGEIDRAEPRDEDHVDRADRHLEQVRPRPAARRAARARAASARRSRAARWRERAGGGAIAVLLGGGGLEGAGCWGRRVSSVRDQPVRGGATSRVRRLRYHCVAG